MKVKLSLKMNNFNQYSEYYDLINTSKDYKSESSYVLDVLNKYSEVQLKSILELGSGTGNYSEYFCKKSIEVTGIELSKDMVNISLDKEINGFYPIHGDISIHKENKTFDAVISLFHVISYLTDNDSLINCFLNTNHHLVSGGIFLFDIWYTPAVLTQLPETRIRRISSENLNITRLAEPIVYSSKNIVEVNYEIWLKNNSNNELSIINEKHPMRHFSIPEIEMLAHFTGFELLRVEEFLTGAEPSKETWGVCFILKKI